MDKFKFQAKLIMENKLNFIHPWDMERCDEIYDIPKNWNISPNGDDEWVYMRSRMGYFDGLILLYEETKDIKYIDKIKEIILDFISQHKKLKSEKSTRTLDSGIRIVNILRILIYLEDKNLEYDKNILKHLSETCTYLFSNYISKYDQSNWGFIQMAGVYTFSIYFGENEKAKKALKYLKMQLKTQILEDGLHWEKSLTYHYQMIIYLIFIIYVQKRKNIKSNLNFFKSYLNKMTKAAKKLHYPDKTQINFGDSDDNEIESILALSDYILSKESEYKLTDISSLFIKEAKVKKMEVKKGLEESLFQQSGYYHIKNEDFSFSTYCTPMSSSHTHIDYLHFNYYNKQKIFVDSGRYTYRESKQRKYLKSIKAHNSILIDDNEVSEIKGSWEYEGYPIIFPITVYSTKIARIVKTAIFDTKNQAVIKRTYIILKENILVINQVFCKGKHKIKFFYHLYPNTDIKETKSGILLNNVVKFLINSYNIQNSTYSPYYNCLVINKEIIKEADFLDNYFEINAILNKDVQIKQVAVYQKEKKVEDDIALAYEIKIQDITYTIFIKNKEIYKGQKVFHVKGRPFYEEIKIVKDR